MRGNVFADEIQKTIRAGYVRNSWNEEIYFLSFVSTFYNKLLFV